MQFVAYSWTFRCLIYKNKTYKMSKNLTNVWTLDRNRGATLKLGGGGEGTISDSIFGGTRHFFLLNLYNFINIGGGGGHVHPCPLLRGLCLRPVKVFDQRQKEKEKASCHRSGG